MAPIEPSPYIMGQTANVNGWSKQNEYTERFSELNEYFRKTQHELIRIGTPKIEEHYKTLTHNMNIIGITLSRLHNCFLVEKQARDELQILHGCIEEILNI